MKAINDLISPGGEIVVPGGILKRRFTLLCGEQTVAEFFWEKAPPGRAFFDVTDARYEITVPEHSRVTRKRTIQVCQSGEVAAELHSQWSGSSGDIITSNGHRYTFRTPGGCLTLEREVGHEVVLTISRRAIRRGRRVEVQPSDMEGREFAALLAAVLAHVLAKDYGNDKIAIAAASGGAG